MNDDVLKAKIIMTHDLTCAFGELTRAAQRYARFSSGHPMGELAIAAIAFTIQAAIEEGRDPIEMRSLERDLLAAMIGKQEPAHE